MAAPARFSNGGGLDAASFEAHGQQLKLAEVGVEGQRRLRGATACVVGAGGLGCPAALYLAGAGLGRLVIADGDSVALSNLHRQIIYTRASVGRKKAAEAAAACRARHALTEVVAVEEHVTAENAAAILAPCDVVIDGSDNARTRYLLNEACARLRRPLVSGSALRWEGQLSVFNAAPGAPCYRCVFPDIPAVNNGGACDADGIVGPVVGAIGTLQALEAIKLLLGRATLVNRLLIFDALSLDRPFRVVRLAGKRHGCSTCGEGSRQNGALRGSGGPAFAAAAVPLALASTWSCGDMVYPEVPEEWVISPKDAFAKLFVIEKVRQRGTGSGGMLDVVSAAGEDVGGAAGDAAPAAGAGAAGPAAAAGAACAASASAPERNLPIAETSVAAVDSPADGEPAPFFVVRRSSRFRVIDVRHPNHVAALPVPGTVNIPIEDLLHGVKNGTLDGMFGGGSDGGATVASAGAGSGADGGSVDRGSAAGLGAAASVAAFCDIGPVYILCRKGRDAARAVVTGRARGLAFFLIRGGLQGLRGEVPELRNFPFL